MTMKPITCNDRVVTAHSNAAPRRVAGTTAWGGFLFLFLAGLVRADSDVARFHGGVYDGDAKFSNFYPFIDLSSGTQKIVRIDSEGEITYHGLTQAEALRYAMEYIACQSNLKFKPRALPLKYCREIGVNFRP